ncbi:MAG: hypothetical protein PHF50_00190 [Patescibacteria group bacterium]|nr:hypothetical protein [Patescibacteria group bacterium]
MSFEKIGKVIGTIVEVLEILATGKLTGAIMRLFHAKDINNKAGSSVATATGDQANVKTDDGKIKSGVIGWGPEDNIIRESIINLLATKDQIRETTYRNFETWLEKEHFFDWVSWIHFFTIQAEKLPDQAVITLNNIIDAITLGGGNDAGLKYIQGLTGEIYLKLLKAYGKKFFEMMEALAKKYPWLSVNELTKLLNEGVGKIEESLDHGEAWVNMQQQGNFWQRHFCPWRLLQMPPDVSSYNQNYHNNGGGI